jgi:hypothetical protein
MNNKDNAALPRDAARPAVPITRVDGRMVVAPAETESEMASAVAALRQTMAEEGFRNGVVVISKNLALRRFGPVPKDWLRDHITMFRSPVDDLDKGIAKFLKEYRASKAAFRPPQKSKQRSTFQDSGAGASRDVKPNEPGTCTAPGACQAVQHGGSPAC